MGQLVILGIVGTAIAGWWLEAVSLTAVWLIIWASTVFMLSAIYGAIVDMTARLVNQIGAN